MIDVEVEDAAWRRALPDAEALCREAAEAAGGTRVVILLTDDDAVADLNSRFRGKAGPTNVLSFPAPPHAAGQTGGHTGDIALAYGVCAREALEQGKPLRHHLQHLVIHGVLHLMGYDHEADADAERMEARERTLLEGLGVPDPYLTPLATPPGDHDQHRR